jgi:hypothetical protein
LRGTGRLQERFSEIHKTTLKKFFEPLLQLVGKKEENEKLLKFENEIYKLKKIPALRRGETTLVDFAELAMTDAELSLAEPQPRCDMLSCCV